MRTFANIRNRWKVYADWVDEKWRRYRWWGLGTWPTNGWAIPKTAWMPVLIAFGVCWGLRIADPIEYHMAPLWALFLGAPWIAFIIIAYRIFFYESNDKYPLTQHEAWMAAGMQNIYQCPNFQRWLDLHGLAMIGVISFDYTTGDIRPGRFSWDPIMAKQGLPQVEGPCAVRNDYHWYNGPIYQRLWMEYGMRFGNQQMLDRPPKIVGIAPQPSIPK